MKRLSGISSNSSFFQFRRLQQISKFFTSHRASSLALLPTAFLLDGNTKKFARKLDVAEKFLKIDFKVHTQDNGNVLITVFRKTVFPSQKSTIDLYQEHHVQDSDERKRRSYAWHSKETLTE